MSEPNYFRVSRPNAAVLDLSVDRNLATVPYTRVGRPAVVLDLSAPKPVLEFEVSAENGTPPGAVRERVMALMTTLSDLDVSLGGSGLDVAFASAPGRVKCSVTPRQSAGAEQRLERLKAEIKQAMPEVVL